MTQSQSQSLDRRLGLTDVAQPCCCRPSHVRLCLYSEAISATRLQELLLPGQHSCSRVLGDYESPLRANEQGQNQERVPVYCTPSLQANHYC